MKDNGTRDDKSKPHNHINAGGVREKANRWVHSTIAFVFLLIVFLGFMPFYMKGEGMGGRQISPAMFPWAVTHGALLTGWIVLLFVQATLISSRNHRVHMQLGWGVLVVAVGVVVTGFLIAIKSISPIPNAPFRGMAFEQFMLIMFTQLIVFSCFVGLGIAYRKTPGKHKAMMTLATLCIIGAATIRMPILFSVFGENGWLGIHGPIFALGAIILILRSLAAKSFDRWFAAGYAAMVVIYVAATKFAVSDFWTHAAKAILK